MIFAYKVIFFSIRSQTLTFFFSSFTFALRSYLLMNFRLWHFYIKFLKVFMPLNNALKLVNLLKSYLF